MLNQCMPAKAIVSDCILHNCIIGCQAYDSQGMTVECLPVFEERTEIYLLSSIQKLSVVSRVSLAFGYVLSLVLFIV